MGTTAKVFWTGGTQAVQLPEAFRFSTDMVRIRRSGKAVILEPVPSDWDWLEPLIGQVDEDFIRATEEDPGEQAPVSLDDLD